MPEVSAFTVKLQLVTFNKNAAVLNLVFSEFDFIS